MQVFRTEGLLTRDAKRLRSKGEELNRRYSNIGAPSNQSANSCHLHEKITQRTEHHKAMYFQSEIPLLIRSFLLGRQIQSPFLVMLLASV